MEEATTVNISGSTFPDPSIGFQISTNGFEGIALEPHIVPNSSFINGLMTVEIINPDPNQKFTTRLNKRIHYN